MSEKNKISVVIPAYNEERYLPDCLASIRAQTFQDFELIVVDNNCTDNTAKIAKSFGATVIKEPLRGITHARDAGFNAAKAAIIVRTDADAVVPPNWLAVMYDALEKNPHAVAVSGNIHSPSPTIPDLLVEWLGNSYIYLTKLFTGHYVTIGANMAFRRVAWDAIKKDVHRDDHIVHEDIDIACHLATQGDILFLSQLTVPYSLRRIRKKPFFTIFDYTVRYWRTIALHPRPVPFTHSH